MSGQIVDQENPIQPFGGQVGEVEGVQGYLNKNYEVLGEPGMDVSKPAALLRKEAACKWAAALLTRTSRNFVCVRWDSRTRPERCFPMWAAFPPLQ